MLIILMYLHKILQIQLLLQQPPKPNSGLKITYPEKESAIPTNSSNSFIVKGISKDNTTTADCKVSIIINNVKPYQPVQAWV